MWGAIIGDLAGSIYEYNQLAKISKVEIDKLITKDSFFSDDTILTVAIIDAILNSGSYEEYLKKYGKEYLNYKPDFKPYFNSSFSPNFCKWLNNEGEGNSNGNGAMMRIAPVAYMFDTEEEVLKNATLATIPSHNTQEAIYSATLIAMIIYMARTEYTKEEIVKELNIGLKYEPFTKFNSTCSTTIGNCLYAVFTSSSFEEAIRKVISFGGDTDTNACIVGAMAEILYGIDEKLITQAKEKLPEKFVEVIEAGYLKINDII